MQHPFPEHGAPPLARAASSTAPTVLADLRSLLAERFQHTLPSAHPVTPPPAFATGLPAWDTQTGGVRPGEITEICGGLGATHLVMEVLLERFSRAGWLGAWVDAGDSLEVADWAPRQLQRLVWVRCAQALPALKAADLLLRDGNANWVVLDLQGVAPPALRGICGTHWHRFHRLLAQQGSTLLVLSRNPLVEGVRVRVLAEERWSLEALERPRAELREANTLRVFVRGRMAPALASDPNGIQHRKTA
jgi:hypothetical protein